MTEETSHRVPEVRCKYLTRQIKRRKHRKNVIAAIPQLYEKREGTMNTMKELEQRYAAIKSSPNVKGAQTRSQSTKRITLRTQPCSLTV
jgi:hypothetical protein